MNDFQWDGHQIRTLVAAVFLVLFLTSCIQEAEWTWTGGDISQQDAPADQVTLDGAVDITPGDLHGADADVPIPVDTTDNVEPTDTDVVEPDTADILPGSPVLVVAVPAVFSGESSGGTWTLHPVVPSGAAVGQASAGGSWILKAALEGGSDVE